MKGEVPEGEYVIPFGKAAIRREGARLHDRLVRPPGALRDGGRRDPRRRGRHRVRGDRRTHHSAARPRHDRRERAEDQPLRGGGPVLVLRLGRIRDRGAGSPSTASTTSTTMSIACTPTTCPRPTPTTSSRRCSPIPARSGRPCFRRATESERIPASDLRSPDPWRSS